MKSEIDRVQPGQGAQGAPTQPGADAPLLEVRDLWREFPSGDGTVAVLKGIDLNVQQGQKISLIGPSGSGKTTLLRCVNYLEEPTKGDIYIDNELIGRRLVGTRKVPMGDKELARMRAEIGMVFQRFNLFPHMTALENIIEAPIQVLGVPRAEALEQARGLLARVGLADKAGHYPSMLSGGQQQRVAIARALVFEPELLLLDEPLSALDKNLREQLQTELQRIHRQVGTSFVFVTHDQNEALALSSRIAIFNHGKLTQVDTPENIYNRPESRFVAEFLGKMNLFPLQDTTRNGPTASGRCGDSVLHAQAPSPLSKQPIVLAVRPEHMDLHSERPNREGYNVIPAQLTDKVYQGSSTHLALKVGGDNLPINLSVPGNHPGAQMPSGAPVWLSWPVQQSFLLQA
mgnify:CR=1 FL=1